MATPVDFNCQVLELTDGTFAIQLNITGLSSQKQIDDVGYWLQRIVHENAADIGVIIPEVTQ
jgi:hypothetical protein